MIRQYNYPTTLLFGPGAVAEFATRVGAAERSILLVTDPGLVKVGVAERVAKSLRGAGCQVAVFSSVDGNPTEDNIDAGVLAYREHHAEGIVAVGGGSPMDAAKAIAIMATHDGSITKFDDTKGGGEHIDGDKLPRVYAVPTTAGTGSEVGRAGVVIARETHKKTIFFHPKLLPSMAALDPELTVDLPPHITAATGLDALSHCLEAYLASGYHPMADAIALGGIELVVANLPIAVADGGNLDARGNMLLAATMGGTAFQKGLGAVHSMAHPLGSRYPIHHGLTNALLMPTVLRWQLDEKAAEFTADLLARYARIAQLLPNGEAKAERLPELLQSFIESVGVKGALADHGFKAEDIAALAADAFRDPCHGDNPVKLTEVDFAALFRACL